MSDGSFTAISAMVLLLLAIGARKTPTAEARRGRVILLAVLALFVGVSYYLSAYVSAAASNVWAVLFWILLAGWGFSIRDRGLLFIALFFALFYFAVGIAMPLLLRPAR